MDYLGTPAQVRSRHTGVTLCPYSPVFDRQEHQMRPFIKELVSHLQMHGQYHPLFESYYLDITRVFYVAESAERSAVFKSEAHLFINHVNTRVDEELQRCQAVLPGSSTILVEEVTENALMRNRLDWLATEGLCDSPFACDHNLTIISALKSLMDARDNKGIAILYRLFSRVSGLKVLSSAFKTHVMVCSGYGRS